jgi:hypothetical protein
MADLQCTLVLRTLAFRAAGAVVNCFEQHAHESPFAEAHHTLSGPCSRPFLRSGELVQALLEEAPKKRQHKGTTINTECIPLMPVM